MARIRNSRQRLLRVGAALAFGATVYALAAEPAQAFSIGGMVNGAMKTIFGVKGDFITGSFIQWIIKVPDVPLSASSGPGQVYATTRAFAFAALGAVLTLSVIHFLCAGMAGQGANNGAIGIDGVLRTVGAAAMIVAWPFVVENGVALAHILTDALVPGDKLGDVTKVLTAGQIVNFSGGIPAIMAMLVALAFAVVVLVLFVTKVVMGMGMICIACGMPLALAVWPLPGLAWLANGLARWLFAIVAVSIAWAVEIDIFARIAVQDILFQGGGAWADKLIKPLTVIALLLVMLSTSKSILRLAGMPASGGGVAGHAAALMASRFGMNALARGIPDRFGGMRDTIAQRNADAAYRELRRSESHHSSSSRGVRDANRRTRNGSGEFVKNDVWLRESSRRLREEAEKASGAPRSESPRSDRSRKDARNPTAEPPKPPLAQDGIPTRTGHADAHRRGLERMDRLREAGTWHSPAKVADALGTLEGAGLDAGAVAGHIETFGGNDRHVMGRMADAELAPGLSPQAAGAFRTIGVADPAARASGVSLWRSGQSSASTAGGGGASEPRNGRPPAPSRGSATRPAGPPTGNGRATRPPGPPPAPPTQK